MRRHKILVVDRDQKARKNLSALFNGSHYDVVTTPSAAHAIAKIVQKEEPIVILGDSFEERISPVDVIALMRKCNRNLRIILVSDDSSLETLRQVRADGIFYHALMPTTAEDNEELCSVVSCAFEGMQPA